MTAEKITQGTEGLNVLNEPIIPFIIGNRMNNGRQQAEL